MKSQKTFMAKKENVQRKWYVVDVEGKTLGRIASRIATILMGKHKPTYTPHVDVGDYVVVINASKVALSGKKLEDKMYYHHSGYIGGLKSISACELLKKHPNAIIYEAVRRMLPKSKLGRAMLKKLKVHPGQNHPHKAQNPQPLELNYGTQG